MSEPKSDLGSQLGRRLLDVGRAEEPTAGALERALATAASAPTSAVRGPARWWLMAGLGAAAAAAVAAGLFVRGAVAPRSVEAPAAQTAAPATASGITAEAVATASAAPSAFAGTSSSSAPSDSATAVAQAPTAPATPHTKGGAATPPKVPPSSTALPAAVCGCAPSDLACNMRCSEKK